MDREPLIPFESACRLRWLPLRRKGSQLSVRTLTRWHIDGQLAAGRRIHLRAVRVGRQLCTRESWMEEHFTAVEEAELAGPGVASGPPKPERRESDARAILDAAGI